MSNSLHSQFKAACWILAILFVLLVGGCSEEENKVQNDQFYLNLINRSDSKEALSWLTKKAESDVGGGETEYSHKDSIKLIEDLYESGAKKVVAAKIQPSNHPNGGTVEYTDTLIITMPKEASKRNSIFEIAAKNCQPEFEPEKEQGQNYLLMWWD